MNNQTENIQEECYKLLWNCILFETIEDFGEICNNLTKIRDYKNLLPKETYNKIDQFIHETIHPIIFQEEYFDFLKTDELGTFDEDGVFHIKSEEALEMSIYLLYKHTLELQTKLNEFAIEHLSISPCQLKTSDN